MKNYSYYILLTLMFVAASSAKAAVTSMNDLFGKYKFTATMTVTDAGKSYTADFSDNCEVTIEESSSSYYQAQIVGFAGATGKENIFTRGFDASACTFSAPNPGGNNYNVFADGLTVANAQGAYPYTSGNSPELTFTFDPTSKSMTVSDFTIVGNFDYPNSTCETFATFTNVKLTLIEAASTELADLSGAWNIVAGSQASSTYESSTLPTSYILTLTQTSNGVYTAQFDVEGLPSFTLDGTFDGSKLTIAFDNKVIDSEKGIQVKDFNTASNAGTITFTYSDDTLTGLNPLYIAENSMPMQWWSNTTGTRKSEDSFAWDGTYTVSTKNVFALDGGTWASPFEMTITKNGEKYYVSSFMGNDVYTLNTGSMSLTVADNNQSASICIDGVSNGYGAAFLKMDESYKFYSFCDINDAKQPLKMTRNEDGTITLADFGFYYGAFGASDLTAAAWYIGNTMTKAETGVSSVAVENDVNIKVVGSEIVLDSVQLVTVYDLSGRVAFQGATDSVSGLNGGIYIVKAGNTVAKVSVR